MHAIESIATNFHHACMTGKGWQECQQYCTPAASFTHEGTMLADIDTLEGYVAFIESVAVPVPDFRHEPLSVGVDERQQRVLIHYRIRGTHSGEGLPVPPTGKGFESYSVIVLHFQGDRIHHVDKVWNDHSVMQQAGWV